MIPFTVERFVTLLSQQRARRFNEPLLEARSSRSFLPVTGGTVALTHSSWARISPLRPRRSRFRDYLVRRSVPARDYHVHTDPHGGSLAGPERRRSSVQARSIPRRAQSDATFGPIRQPTRPR